MKKMAGFEERKRESSQTSEEEGKYLIILLIRRQQRKNNPFHHIATALWHRKAKTVSKKKEYRRPYFACEATQGRQQPIRLRRRKSVDWREWGFKINPIDTLFSFSRRLKMPYNIRIVSTYPPRRCGIGTFSRDLAGALSHFTGEVGHIRVAAIDNDHLPYNIPVDLVIDQYNPDSWKNCAKDIIARANESIIPTIVLLQHEYGLDPDGQGRESQGTNFIEMAKVFAEKGLTTFVYLHTVLDEPNEHQKTVLQALAQYSQALIVTTESADPDTRIKDLRHRPQ